MGLGLPPLLVLVIILAVLAYLIYHIAATGNAQPLTIIILILPGFALLRVLYRMRRKVKVQESEDE